MSEDSATPPEPSSTPSTGDAPRSRRISNPRPKKTAKTVDAAEPAPAPVERKASKFPEFPESSEVPEALPTAGDWPEPEAPSAGSPSQSENSKRKRRRRKGKGNQGQNAAQPVDSESASAPDGAGEPSSEAPAPQAPRPQQPPRTRLDPELLAKFAWKIYLSEVSEEGVALIGDNDAKELSRRCFRLAEIFLEEQSRRR
jgi:hypothetical protein